MRPRAPFGSCAALRGLCARQKRHKHAAHERRGLLRGGRVLLSLGLRRGVRHWRRWRGQRVHRHGRLCAERLRAEWPQVASLALSLCAAPACMCWLQRARAAFHAQGGNTIWRNPSRRTRRAKRRGRQAHLQQSSRTGFQAVNAGLRSAVRAAGAVVSAVVTIVAGAVAERCKMEGYLIYTVAMSTLVYPVAAHWCLPPFPTSAACSLLVAHASGTAGPSQAARRYNQ